MNRIVECVPNISEGRNADIVEEIADAFRGRKGVRLLDCSSDADHNRSVITAAGEPEAVREAVLEMTRRALALIDLRKHTGVHPRMGAVDVIPFIPVSGTDFAGTAELARSAGREIAREGIPVYFYGRAALRPEHENLADCRRGEFEGLREKMLDPVWRPDCGPSVPHASFGAAAVGCRKFLCAFNVNLASDDLAAAREIAKKVRASGGGLACCKAIGVRLESRGIVQVSMNLTDYSVTDPETAFGAVRDEAAALGIGIAGSEIIGLVPAEALAPGAAGRIMLENSPEECILEKRLYG